MAQVQHPQIDKGRPQLLGDGTSDRIPRQVQIRDGMVGIVPDRRLVHAEMVALDAHPGAYAEVGHPPVVLEEVVLLVGAGLGWVGDICNGRGFVGGIPEHGEGVPLQQILVVGGDLPFVVQGNPRQGLELGGGIVGRGGTAERTVLAHDLIPGRKGPGIGGDAGIQDARQDGRHPVLAGGGDGPSVLGEVGIGKGRLDLGRGRGARGPGRLVVRVGPTAAAAAAATDDGGGASCCWTARPLLHLGQGTKDGAHQGQGGDPQDALLAVGRQHLPHGRHDDGVDAPHPPPTATAAQRRAVPVGPTLAVTIAVGRPLGRLGVGVEVVDLDVGVLELEAGAALRITAATATATATTTGGSGSRVKGQRM